MWKNGFRRCLTQLTIFVSWMSLDTAVASKTVLGKKRLVNNKRLTRTSKKNLILDVNFVANETLVVSQNRGYANFMRNKTTCTLAWLSVGRKRYAGLHAFQYRQFSCLTIQFLFVPRSSASSSTTLICG